MSVTTVLSTKTRPEIEDAAMSLHPRPQGGIVGLVSILTLSVAIFGYLRDATLAAHFGLSTTMDAYFAALFVPTMLYMLLITGTLSPVFIPILLQEGATEGQTKLSETFSTLTNFVLLCLAGIVCIGLVSARKWLSLIFSGFDIATSVMALHLVYIILPCVLFVALAGILSSALNGFNKFALPAIAPALSSIAVIAAAMLAGRNGTIYIVGVATALGFLLQVLLLLPPTAALGIRYKFVLNPRHPSIGKLVRVGGPLLLYLVVANGSSLLERHLASHLPGGALSTISYATRLFIIPSNFLAAPLAIVAYPRFALEALNEHYGDLSFQVTRTLRAVCFVFLPVSVWIVLNALPLTRLLYERGQFSMEDSIITSRVLTLYAIGVLPNAITVILLRCFYAIQDTLTPLWVESLDLLFYLAVASFLTNRYGITGLALTRGLQFILVATLLLIVLWRRRKLLTINANFCGFLLRTAVAASVMASVSWITLQLLRAVFNAGGTSLRLVIVSGAMLTSAISFWAMARAFKIPEAVYILNLVVATVPRTQMQLRMCRQFFNDKLRCRTL